MHINDVEKVAALKASIAKLTYQRDGVLEGSFNITIHGVSVTTPKGVYAEVAKNAIVAEANRQIGLANTELKLLGVFVD